MERNISANKRIAKNSIFMSVRMVIVLMITLYTSRIILNILGVEDYGIYNVVAGFVTMFGFLNSSLSNGIQRFFNYELGKSGAENANKVYNMALLIQVILALIVILPTEIIGTWYLHNKMVIPTERIYAAEWIFQLSLLTFLFHILQVPYIAAVMAHERMDFYALVSVFNTLISLGCVYVISFCNGDHLILYGILMAFIAFITLILYVIYTKKKFKEIYIRRKFYKSLFKEMLSFSGWNVFGTLGQMLKDQGVNLILNFFFGPILNAARGIANQVNGGIQSFVMNITIPVRPQVVQSYSQGNVIRSLNLTYTISKLSCFVLLIISLPILLEIDYILFFWLGENIPDYTSIFIIIIVLNSFLSNLNSAISGVVHASGKMKKYQLCGGSISILSIVIVYIAMLIWKIPTIALCVIVFMDIIRQIVALIVLKSIVLEFSFNKYLKSVIIPLLLVCMVGILLPIYLRSVFQNGILRLILVFVSCELSIGASIYFFGLNMNEKHLVKKVFFKIISKLYRHKFIML